MLEQKITFDRFIRWALTALLVITIIFITKSLSNVLLPFVIAWLLAYLLYPIVKFVQYKLHVPTRALSIIITLLFVFGIITGIFFLIIPPMIEQFDKLSGFITRYITHSSEANDITSHIREWMVANQDSIEKFFKSKDFAETVKTAMPKVFSVLGQTANIIISVIASCITLLYMFFILLDYEFLTEKWIKIFPKKNRPFWKALAKDVERELNNYIRGQSLVSLIMGIMFCIGCIF